MRLKAPTMSASGDDIALASPSIDLPPTASRSDNANALQAGLGRTQQTQSLQAPALPDGLYEKAHGEIAQRLQTGGYSPEETERIARALAINIQQENRGPIQGVFIRNDFKTAVVKYKDEGPLTEFQLPHPEGGASAPSRHRPAGVTQVAHGIVKEVDAQGRVSFGDRPVFVENSPSKTTHDGVQSKPNAGTSGPDLRYTRPQASQDTGLPANESGGKARAQAQIDAIREDGTGVRVGGAKVSLTKAEIKAAYGENPLAGGKQNMAAVKKSTGIDVSIGEPCKGNEVALSPWSWKWIEKKLGVGDGPAKASASVQGPGVSIDPACVDPAKVVRRTAAEFTDTVINNSGFLGNTVNKINDRSDWINSEIEKGSVTQTQPKK